MLFGITTDYLSLKFLLDFCDNAIYFIPFSSSFAFSGFPQRKCRNPSGPYFNSSVFQALLYESPFNVSPVINIQMTSKPAFSRLNLSSLLIPFFPLVWGSVLINLFHGFFLFSQHLY
ncbi:unnamed protein product [Rangifer tarandus platyrhynchus]|uniref:Uncharacterized protein n=1 Tax=Rangifer tarandus platyrhynchus TaxID=3082113 RepID=A0ABN9A5J6_RANTA|nr:unnamed protein product [Rangifer tarandus platyrhynchus]